MSCETGLWRLKVRFPRNSSTRTSRLLQAATAQVDAAKANMAQAELNLAWTKVYSPIDGVAGISNSNVGDLVGMTTKMTTCPRSILSGPTSTSSERDYLGEAQAISRLIRGAKERGPALPMSPFKPMG